MTHEVHAAIAPVSPEWDALADRTGAPPFLRPGWFDAWFAAFGKGSPEVLAVRDAGRLVAVLPMQRRAGALVAPSNWHTPQFDAVAEPGAEGELAAMLLGRRARHVTLAFVDPAAPLVAALRAHGGAAGRRLLLRTVERSPYLPISGNWDDFERARLSGDRRRTIGTRRRRLQDMGALGLEVSDGRVDLARRLVEVFGVEARSWKGEAGTAIGARPDTRRFYTELASWAAERGFLRLAFLRVDDRPAAFDLSLEDRGVHYMLKSSYDPAFARGAPGLVLRAEMLARAFGQGLKRYEFLGQDEPWKLLWTDECRDVAVVHAFAGATGALEWAAHAYGRPAAERGLAVAAGARAGRRGRSADRAR
jgi:CelD/BcsL family acetyltransferase involved in cellulose biosynthesis